MTTALLTARAMLDGTVPTDRKNLRELAQALSEANALLATVPKYDLEPGDDPDGVVDVAAMIRTVADDLSLVSSATGVRLTVAADPAGTCRALRGDRQRIYAALEDALHALMVSLPAGSAITVGPRAADILELSVTFADGRPDRLECLSLPGTCLCGSVR